MQTQEKKKPKTRPLKCLGQARSWDMPSKMLGTGSLLGQARSWDMPCKMLDNAWICLGQARSWDMPFRQNLMQNQQRWKQNSLHWLAHNEDVTDAMSIEFDFNHRSLNTALLEEVSQKRVHIACGKLCPAVRMVESQPR